MNLPKGWKAETETVDRIRLEVPRADLGITRLWLDERGYETVDMAEPVGMVDGLPVACRVTGDRPSRSVPLDELLPWLDDLDDDQWPWFLRDQAEEKWGEPKEPAPVYPGLTVTPKGKR